MSLTSRDIENISRRKPPKALSLLESFIKLLIWPLRPLFRIPPLKRHLSESVGGLSGSIFRWQREKDHEQATKTAIHALQIHRDRRSKYLHHHSWWCFMKYGVDSARQIENEEFREKLITLASTGIEPFEGYDVAYSYLEF